MKTYRITMTTEYIIEANTEEEALDMVDYSYETESYCDSIEELPDTETINAIVRKFANRIGREEK